MLSFSSGEKWRVTYHAVIFYLVSTYSFLIGNSEFYFGSLLQTILTEFSAKTSFDLFFTRDALSDHIWYLLRMICLSLWYASRDTLISLDLHFSQNLVLHVAWSKSDLHSTHLMINVELIGSSSLP